MKPIRLLVILALLILLMSKFTEAQIYTNSVKSKYVKTTVDTFFVPGLTTVERTGFITNESSTKQLLVYFSFTNSSAKDTSTRVLIEPGKTLHFRAKCSKIYRNAVTDSAYSQIIIGDVQLNYIPLHREYEYSVLTRNFDKHNYPDSEFTIPDKNIYWIQKRSEKRS